MLLGLEKLDIALNDLRPRDVAPAPELRCGGTREARNRGPLSFVLDGDSPPLLIGKRRVAVLALSFALQKQAMFLHPGIVYLPDPVGDGFRESRLVGFAQCRERNRLPRAIDGDRLQRRLHAQRVHDRPRQTSGGIRIIAGFRIGGAAHGPIVSQEYHNRRPGRRQIERSAPDRCAHPHTASGARPSGRFRSEQAEAKRLTCALPMMKRKRRAPQTYGPRLCA